MGMDSEELFTENVAADGLDNILNDQKIKRYQELLQLVQDLLSQDHRRQPL
jgi:hypothetical protein